VIPFALRSPRALSFLRPTAARRRPRPPVRPQLEELERRLAPATFTVSNTNDAGAGSLRLAILDSNATPGLDTIAFNVPGAGGHTITPLSPLPFVTDPVILDGTTQPGYAGAPLIQLSGGSAGAGANGLVVTAGGTLVRGLAVGGFSGIGILLATNGGDVVAANYVGTNPTGTAAAPNAFGVAVAGGGADQVGGNVLSGNTFYGLTLNGTSGDVVAGNLVGVNAADSVPVANGAAGVTLDGAATGNVLNGNVIGGNAVFGVLLYGPGVTGNTLAGNLVGLNPAGTALANGFAGVALGAGAAGNSVGGPTPAYRNVISDNTVDGVYVEGAGTNNNVIESDYVGTNPAGGAAAANGVAGIAVQDGAANNLVGVDLISGNGKYGVELTGAGTSGNIIGSCLIGSNAAGNAALGNGFEGVLIQAGAAGNTVSGDLIAAQIENIDVEGVGTSGNVVQASLIGTNLAGTAALGTTTFDVFINGGTGNLVGGPTVAQRNVIAGATNVGVVLDAVANVVMNNLVGTNAAGTAALPNGTGIALASNNDTCTGNVVSGNGIGINIDNGTGDLVEGNFVGTNAAGTAALPNGIGVWLTGGTGNTVGGTTAAARNVISGNSSAGVEFANAFCNSNVVEGNLIGTRADGVTALGNGAQGVFVEFLSHDNTVGGTAAGAGNVIAFNGDDGVLIGGLAGSTSNLAGVGNSVLGNSIFGNGKVGIDLGPDDGVTANGFNGNSGPNDYENFPVLTSSVAAGGAVFVTGTLPIHFIGTYRIEFFADPAPDPSGHGQGQTFLGFVTVTAESSTLTFAAILAGPLSAGQAVSATATFLQTGDTSEFSADVLAQ
jgi:titin